MVQTKTIICNMLFVVFMHTQGTNKKFGVFC